MKAATICLSNVRKYLSIIPIKYASASMCFFLKDSEEIMGDSSREEEFG
jgi:hypothetical protein